MKIVKIPLAKLYTHPANANVMSKEVLDKLRGHIEEGGNYEPLVVRDHPQKKGYFQIINGHHRKRALEQLGHADADCVVWEVSDDQTLMLLATLNRLTGQDDPQRRGALLERLSRRYEPQKLLARLPETQAQLEKLLRIIKPPQPIEPEQLGEMPQAMIFFVKGEQRKKIDQSLKKVRERYCRQTSEKKVSRGDLLELMALMVQNA